MKTRTESILQKLRDKATAGGAIIGAGAGSGISAKFIDRGGADLIFIYNSGRFRMAGLSSWAGHLCFGDANQIVLDMGEREVLHVVRRAPVIAGVCGFDLTRRMSHFLPKTSTPASLASSTTRSSPSSTAACGRTLKRAACASTKRWS